MKWPSSIASAGAPETIIAAAPIALANLIVAVALAGETTLWGRELERPEEVGHLFEMWSNRVDLMNNVLTARNFLETQNTI